MRDTILICGAYGLGNAGDEAILTAILRQVRQAAPESAITVLSRNPEETAALHGVQALHMFDLPAVHRVMNRTKLYINGGGSLIQDVTSRRSLWYYLYTLYAAKKRGCKVLMYGCGIGPVSRAGDVNLSRKILNRYVDAITLREPSSLEELQRMGVSEPEIRLTADPALTLCPAEDAVVDAVLEKAGIPPQGHYIAFALRHWKGFEEKAPLFGKAAQYAYETHGLTPVFFAVEKRQDPAAARLAAEGLTVPHYFLDDTGDSASAIGALSRMEAAVSMRLHALIFSAGQGVPLAGVVYDPKVSTFLRYIGQEIFTDLSDLTEENLRDMIDRAVALRQQPEVLHAVVKQLQEMEQGNIETAHRLLHL